MSNKTEKLTFTVVQILREFFGDIKAPELKKLTKDDRLDLAMQAAQAISRERDVAVEINIVDTKATA